MQPLGQIYEPPFDTAWFKGLGRHLRDIQHYFYLLQRCLLLAVAGIKALLMKVLPYHMVWQQEPNGLCTKGGVPPPALCCLQHERVSHHAALLFAVGITHSSTTLVSVLPHCYLLPDLSQELSNRCSQHPAACVFKAEEAAMLALSRPSEKGPNYSQAGS